MKGSFSFSPIGIVMLEELIALANPSVNPPLYLNETIVGVPLANVGEKNTRINLVFKPDGRFTGPVDFFYNRIDLSEIQVKIKETPHVGPLAEGEIPTAASVLALFQQKYGITFEAGEIAASIPSVIDGTNYGHEVTLTANPNSLVWKGTLTVKVMRRGLLDFQSDVVPGTYSGGLLYLLDYPFYANAGGSSGIFCDGDVPPFELNANSLGGIPAFGLVEITDAEQKVVDIINAHGQRLYTPLTVTINKTDVEIIRRENSHPILRARSELDWKRTAYTSFYVRAKETSNYVGEIPYVGWELYDIKDYLTRRALPTFYFQSGQQIDILKLLPRIKEAYNIDLETTEVEQTAGEPLAGLGNGYTIDLVMNKTSLHFSGSVRFTVDVSGDPYRYISNAYLGDFGALTWNNA